MFLLTNILVNDRRKNIIAESLKQGSIYYTKGKNKSFSTERKKLAERVGFEPTILIIQDSGFRDRRLKPLGHLSSILQVKQRISLLASKNLICLWPRFLFSFF